MGKKIFSIQNDIYLFVACIKLLLFINNND